MAIKKLHTPHELSPALHALEQRLGHVFAQPALLEQALTHRSFSSHHYERLEFLGDSVLNMAVSGLLYERLDSFTEGDLSRVRANLVKEGTLYKLAQELGVPGLMRLGEGEAHSGGHQRPSILADAMEAMIGAVYLDAGFAEANALVRRLYHNIEINPHMQAASKDAKTELQEWLQGRKMHLPSYHVAGITGAAHKQTFDVECRVEELKHSEHGQGGSRRAAEQAAAEAMLNYLKANSP